MFSNNAVIDPRRSCCYFITVRINLLFLLEVECFPNQWGSVDSIQISPDSLVLTLVQHSSIKFISLRTKVLLLEIKDIFNAAIKSAEFSPDSELVAVAGDRWVNKINRQRGKFLIHIFADSSFDNRGELLRTTFSGAFEFSRTWLDLLQKHTNRRQIWWARTVTRRSRTGFWRSSRATRRRSTNFKSFYPLEAPGNISQLSIFEG